MRQSHDCKRVNEPKANRYENHKYSTQRLFNSLPRSVKDSGTISSLRKKSKKKKKKNSVAI